MSTQAAFARLALAMKKAVKRRAEDYPDSDDSIERITNRGNKLRKKAKYVREGQLAPLGGLDAYKKTITHAGFERDIISEKPTVYDDEGYEIDSEDEDEESQAALAAAAEFYPYANIKLENILAPLTKPAELPEHPTLSRPFTSKPLTELTHTARNMAQKEKATLWKMKNLFTKFSGDLSWVPCEILETPNDINLFDDGRCRYREHLVAKERAKAQEALVTFNRVEEKAKVSTESARSVDDDARITPTATETTLHEGPSDDEVEMVQASSDIAVKESRDTDNNPNSQEGAPAAAKGPLTVQGDSSRTLGANNEHKGLQEKLADATQIKIERDIMEQGHDANQDRCSSNGNSMRREGLEVIIHNEEGIVEELELEPTPRRMRTRAQAQAASDSASQNRSMTPESNESYVHPFFLAPESAHPDPNIGLPSHEAEETRKLLQLYIQKQEEVCRGAEKLYTGLMKAERLRKSVYKWAKADGHKGKMSDEEDWYDMEEWGLTEELKKGQDEEDEDAATTAKKTRTRRQ